MSKVVDIDKNKKHLYSCLVCKLAWAGHQPLCPTCSSTHVIHDELHVVPSSHDVYACKCNANVFFKIAKHPRHGLYFKCATCGMKHYPSHIGLTNA